MKKSISEGIFLFLSIILIVSAVSIYILFGKKETTTISYPKQIKMTSSEENKNDTLKIKSSLDKLEKSLSRNDIQSIQDAINILKKEEDKANLQKRLDEITEQIDTIEAAENAISQAEINQTQDSIDYAQSLVSSLQNSAKKTDLQKRIDSLIIQVQANLQPSYTTNVNQSTTSTNDTNIYQTDEN